MTAATLVCQTESSIMPATQQASRQLTVPLPDAPTFWTAEDYKRSQETPRRPWGLTLKIRISWAEISSHLSMTSHWLQPGQGALPWIPAMSTGVTPITQDWASHDGDNELLIYRMSYYSREPSLHWSNNAQHMEADQKMHGQRRTLQVRAVFQPMLNHHQNLTHNPKHLLPFIFCMTTIHLWGYTISRGATLW